MSRILFRLAALVCVPALILVVAGAPLGKALGAFVFLIAAVIAGLAWVFAPRGPRRDDTWYG